MSSVSVGYALWNRRHLFDSETEYLLTDIDFALDSIITLFVHHDIDAIIAHMADETDHTHVVIYASGTRVKRAYKLDTEWHAHCSGHWLVSGHILSRVSDQYPRLHEQTIAINLGLWRSVGRPSVGYAGSGYQLLADYERSPENIHDDYTPLWLKSRQSDPIGTDVRKLGWNLISCSLSHGIDVVNLPTAVRQEKVYVYPEDHGRRLAAATQKLRGDHRLYIERFDNHSQEDWISYMRWFLQDTITPIFIFNTADLYETLDAPAPDSIWTTASGFKSFVEWYKRGSLSSCRIDTYDYNAKSLKLWQTIHREWTGDDIYAFMRQYDDDCDNEERYCWGNKLAVESTRESSARQEQEMVQYFGGRGNLQVQWRAFQNLEHSYHHCNIVTEHHKILDELEADRTHLIWVNNIFFFRLGILKYGLQALNNSLCALVNAIAETAPNTYLFGQCSRFHFEHQAKNLAKRFDVLTDHKHQWYLNANRVAINISVHRR